MRETPGRETSQCGNGGRKEDQGIQAHLVGEYTEGPLADYLSGAHHGEQHSAIAGAETDGGSV